MKLNYIAPEYNSQNIMPQSELILLTVSCFGFPVTFSTAHDHYK